MEICKNTSIAYANELIVKLENAEAVAQVRWKSYSFFKKKNHSLKLNVSALSNNGKHS